jgi:alanyl-tRNA synthetase
MKALSTDQIRQAYLDFFKSKGHAVIPGAPLIPENDPTTLFTGSGMQPMIPYLLGEKHPLGSRITDSQKSFRSQDIEEIGDNRHTTMFEMLGNWSLGDYFKAEQIPWMFEFLTSSLQLDPSRLYITVFRGLDAIPRDDEAVALWQQCFKGKGIDAQAVDHADTKGMQGGRIFFYDRRRTGGAARVNPQKCRWASRVDRIRRCFGISESTIDCMRLPNGRIFPVM